ncbi:hypothetical protein QVG61_05505 [Thiohalobacter sp. IOR34]|uniref:hypothetical protein n=1 Tax=Thiohalobacter sp. IOR34 TaxID=3057176 RepID=UPI0025B1EC17|nr:hypothetical protein [Thiohalobacter sp. IOR34]WJW76545.1 hypothetical protein QVG61_05505 [Thiohalobacter sp. IOR34]
MPVLLWLVALLLPLHAARADDTAAEVFRQLPEEIQNRILDETSKARQECSMASLRRAHYDCNCVAEAFKQARTLGGPQPPYHELYSGAFEKRCIDREAVTKLYESQCMQQNSVKLQAGARDYCACYGEKTAERFLDKPYFSNEYRGLVHREVSKACDWNRYLAAVLARQEKQKPQAAPPAAPSGVGATPYPWEWLSLGMPPEEVERNLLAAGLKVRFNRKHCFDRKYCDREYIGALPGTKYTRIRLTVRKRWITGLNMEISYPPSARAEVEKRLGSSISDAMLKPAEGQSEAKAPYCNAKRTTCYNIPDPTTPAESPRMLYRHFGLGKDKAGRWGRLSYRINAAAYLLSELGLTAQ